MNRRSFVRTTVSGAAALQMAPIILSGQESKGGSVRLGGPLFESYENPDEWIGLLRKAGYRAAYCPVKAGTEESLIKAYESAARKADVIISEVGAWSNPLSLDAEEAGVAFDKCVKGLQLADLIGASCCVNVSGSRNPSYWAGPHKDNLTPEVFDAIVEITRKIIDEVKPTRTFFALEAMPWAYPDSTDSYLRLIAAIDRPQFGVHLDPVNLITSPRDYFNNGKLIKDMFYRLGPRIKSCHAKDISLREDNYIPQLDEVRAGLGQLDYAVFLKEVAKLDNIPLMMEHLKTAEEYALAADHIRSVGKANGITF